MAYEIKKILFATNLSNNCRHAFTYATSISSRYCGEIILLHVMEAIPGSVDTIVSGFLGKEKWEILQKQIENNARMTLIGKKTNQAIIHDAIDAFSKEEKPNECDYTINKILVKEGHIVDSIIETSVEESCDLIIIGSHMGIFSSDASLGQTAKGVLKQSKIPVMVIPPIE